MIDAASRQVASKVQAESAFFLPTRMLERDKKSKQTTCSATP